MARPAKVLLKVMMLFATLLIVLIALWGGLAIWYRAPWPGAYIALFGLFVLAGLVLFWRSGTVWPALGLLAVAFGAVFIWWGTIRPLGDRAWAVQLARVPSVSIDGDRFTITNVRNFVWRAKAGAQDIGATEDVAEEVAEERWETRTHDLSKTSGVDLFFSYWTGPLIAHVLVSITFDDAAPLTFSIEIRREQGEDYSPLAGFFKSYELAIVAADERDIVKLRTHVWREDVRLYRLTVSREKARALLLAYAAEINALAAQPRWYDTLGANCSTVAYRLARELWPGLAFDWRILFPGRAPDYAYEIGAVRTDIPLEDLRSRAAISEIARALPVDADFSAAIRAAVPQPR